MNLVKSAISVALIAISVYLTRRFFAGCICSSDTRLDGKTVVITGGNTGIGLKTAQILVGRGARVVIACRSEERCSRAAALIGADMGKEEAEKRVAWLLLDLASTASIRSFASTLLAQEPRLDVLINNAAVMALDDRQETVDGFEMQIGVNHLGHFLLTHLLLDRIKASAPSRIIVVASSAHMFGRDIDPDQLLLEKDYGPWRAYGWAKMANILHARELARRLEGTGVVAVSLHPGAVATELQRNSHWILNYGVWASQLLFSKTPWEGAQTSVCCALQADLAENSGAFFSDCYPKEPWSASDPEAATKLWTASEKLLGIKCL